MLKVRNVDILCTEAILRKAAYSQSFAKGNFEIKTIVYRARR